MNKEQLKKLEADLWSAAALMNSVYTKFRTPSKARIFSSTLYALR